LTFIDSGLLILAARGTDALSNRAMQVLDDPNREFATSAFVRLEVLPKAEYNGQVTEAEFYKTFFEAASAVVPVTGELVAQAEEEAEHAGLSAMDALHIAAAREAGCSELVTAEKSTKPIFRVAGITVTTIRP
jgi:predicted nucleic acid-binding protein